MNEPIRSSENSLLVTNRPALDSSPAAVYLARLKHSSRRPQKQALNLVASLLTAGQADCQSLDWSQLRYQHTAAVRSKLLDNYSPATANRILSALRGVLEEAWLLGQMSAEDYHRAARINSIIGESLPAGRVLSQQEIRALLNDCAKDPHKGVDIATVAKLAGHSNIQTTARYDRRPEERKRRAAHLLKIPYFRRK